MKIRKLGIFLILILSFFVIDNVSAMSCADIDKELKNYETINAQLSKYDCSDVENEETVSNCKKLNLEKNASLSEIYRISEQEKNCPSKVKEAKTIIEANKDVCGVVLGDFVNTVLNYFMGIFYIAGPALLILFGTLDFSKATISGDNDALKKASNKFFKRLLALIFLFLAPAITRIVISLNTSGQYLSGDVYSCDYQNIVVKKSSKVTYVARPEKNTSGSNSGLSGGKQVTGDFINWKQYEGSWKNINIGCGSIQKCGCLLTAVAIQVANSKTAKSPSFNPGTFINAVKSHGGLTSGGGFKWDSWYLAAPSVAPKFQYVGTEVVTGNLSNKASQFKKWLEQGYYPVVEVKNGCGGQHWVAVLSVSGNKIQVADPGRDVTTLPGEYSCFSNYNHQVGLFKVK